MLATDMELAKRILRYARKTQEGLVKRRILSLRLRAQAIRANRVTGRAEVGNNLFARNVEFFALHDHAFRFRRCAGR